ncbi:MAG: alpha-1,4-glucan--maltose-1-phosphate maltosyltransferase [Spartobacteria bacterium]|nr:alpha-1,4-glucan--maltose-1-phosphate maltosyltransferase [Spartobacteria bacterium]
MKNTTVIIEDVYPELDSGRYPVKRTQGEVLDVFADIFKEGHDKITAYILYRKKGEQRWLTTPMHHVDNDRWTGSFSLPDVGRYEYSIRAFGDTYRSWVEEVTKKLEAKVDISSEVLEGLALVEEAAKCAVGTVDEGLFRDYIEKAKASSVDGEKAYILTCSGVSDLMARYPDESLATDYDRTLQVKVERLRARYASWYEIFPRSYGKDANTHGTFKDCEAILPRIAAAGFDVVYMTPIHPIGEVNRKGRNNTLVAQEGDVGSPYAIGSRFGGHMSIHPELGTMEDFEHFVGECKKLDMEVAIDFAIQCAPDHPYVEAHPEWFFKRPDGTIKFAENPPKKYEDIYPLNFYCESKDALWQEMVDIIMFWADRGVRIFRVDNPHTKPTAFWEWLIAEVQSTYPDAVFLAEAFTRPKVMRSLAKAGFTQSYTYFTWRNTKKDLTDYFEELTQGEMKEYFKGHLFPTTPDILPVMLQEDGEPAFKMRAVLSATLSSLLGIYSGYELCENAALEGREEYLDSEKYECRQRDFNQKEHNIWGLITRLNTIRREHPALQEYKNLRFYRADNEQVLFYGKSTADKKDNILVAVSLDPYQNQRCTVHVPLHKLGIAHDETYQVHDLLSGHRFLWQGEENSIELGPETQMAYVFELRRWIRNENNFDYY